MNEKQFEADLDTLVQRLLHLLDGFSDEQTACLLAIALTTHLHHCDDLEIPIKAHNFLAGSFTDLFGNFEGAPSNSIH
jgi:hypothetical protein